MDQNSICANKSTSNLFDNKSSLNKKNLNRKLICDSINNNNNNNTAFKFYQRFSLCVLEVVRKLQKEHNYKNGVEVFHIVEHLKHEPFIDGDVCSQVVRAIHELETNGFLLKIDNGYKTLGPLAKLCNTKTIKQRRIMYNRLETKLLINSNVNNNNNNNNACYCSHIIHNSKSNHTINNNKHCQRFIQSETNLTDDSNYNDYFVDVNK